MSGINWSRNKTRQRMARQGREVAIDKADLLKASPDDLRKMANKLIAAGNAPRVKPAKSSVKAKGWNRPAKSYPVDSALPAGLVIYADGCCEPNPGVGGWGFVAYLDGREIYCECGGDDSTTNNVMEMTAALMALRWLGGCADQGAARLICDSRYVVTGCNVWRHGWKKKGWRRKGSSALEKNSAIANLDLWKELDAEFAARPMTLEWCRGHAGIVGNERADELSLIGRESVVAPDLAHEMIRQQLQYTI